ncbi:MAG: hypothetical protein JWL81_484 [Verrucomicrobiales bacterium]|nr:hypothetical protein [Verrucomicrobiales bacterium]
MPLLALRLLGGDLAMLQIVAWTGMIVTRTVDQGLAAAVESTVDGEHPCPLCLAVKAAKQAEEKPSPVSPDSLVTKLKLKDVQRTEDLVIPCPQPAAALSPAPIRHLAAIPRDLRGAPPVPPPKSHLA